MCVENFACTLVSIIILRYHDDKPIHFTKGSK